jgi:SAM-dependent methyltransferase
MREGDASTTVHRTFAVVRGTRCACREQVKVSGDVALRDASSGLYKFHAVEVGSGELTRGNSTAAPLNVAYRVGEAAPYVSGRWLDFGCADGGYDEALLAAGADQVVGVDVESARVEYATARQLPGAEFVSYDGHTLPFPDSSFDGVFTNEVLEHTYSDREALIEICRVLRPGGVLVAIAPNRWFPLECHSTTVGSWRSCPTFLVPWLPRRLWAPHVDARNYWPHEMRGLIASCGFRIERAGFIWPVLENTHAMPFLLPASWVRWYQSHFRVFARVPLLRRFGVSNIVVGRVPQ